MDQGHVEAASPLVQQVPNSEVEHSLHLRSQSFVLGQNHRANLTNHAQELFRIARSANDGHGRSILAVSSTDDLEGFSTSHNQMGTEVSSDDSDRLSMMSPSGLSTSSDSSAVGPALTPNLITEGSENVLDLTLSCLIKVDLHHSSPPSVLVLNNSCLFQ